MDLVINVALFNAPGEDKEIQDKLEHYSDYSGEAMEDMLNILQVTLKREKEEEKKKTS